MAVVVGLLRMVELPHQSITTLVRLALPANRAISAFVSNALQP